MPISFDCPHCRRSINAPDSAAGKRAKCPGCAEILAIPLPLEDDAAIDPGGVEDEFGPPPDLGSMDDPFADLGAAAPMPQAPLPSHQPVASHQPAMAQKSSGSGMSYEPMELITAIAAIVHGLVVTGPLMLTFGFIFFAFFSLSGLLILAYLAVSVTILVCGIGLLTKAHWALSVGAAAGGIYLALFALSMILGFISLLSLGIEVGKFGLMFFVWTLPRNLVACAGPVLLIIMNQNDTGGR